MITEIIFSDYYRTFLLCILSIGVVFFMRNAKQIKGINIYNIWFEVLICVICMIYIQYIFRLPREDTIITFKVRMDN